jgi:hypothetical protein
MSVSAIVTAALTVTETVSDTFASTSDNTVTQNGLNTSFTIDANSTVPATKTAAYEVTLSSGTATIDLTALTGLANSSVTGSGLKVQAVIFKNKATNANVISIADGASNGYQLFGNGWLIELPPGGFVLGYLKDQSPDVGGSAKTIDVVGTGAQVLQVQFVMG